MTTVVKAINSNKINVNGREIKIVGSPWNGTVRIGPSKYKIRAGILFTIDENKVVTEISQFGFPKEKYTLDQDQEVIISLAEKFHDYGWDFKKSLSKGHQTKIILEKTEKRLIISTALYTNKIEYTGNNIDFEVKISQYNFTDDKLKQAEIVIGPFTYYEVYDLSSSEITVTNYNTVLRDVMHICDFVNYLVLLDGKKWPGGTEDIVFKFIDDNRSAGYKILSPNQYLGKCDDDLFLVQKENTIYLIDDKNHIVATIFSSPIPFDTVVVNCDDGKIDIKYGEILLTVNITPQLDELLHFEKYAKTFFENIDIFTEFNIMK